MSLSDKEFLQINQALFSLVHAYESRMAREYQPAKTGLTLADRAVIMVVGKFEPVHSRRLSELMDINPGTISQYVQKLVGMGIISKGQDEEDRRYWWLSLTEAGKGALGETLDGTITYTRDFLFALSETEKRTLHGLLLKASRSLGFDWQ